MIRLYKETEHVCNHHAGGSTGYSIAYAEQLTT
jgi:hypothetical protein